MAYFSFTRNILQGKPITIYQGKNRVDLARDFTYIDDIVKGCVGSLDTGGKSTGSGGRKAGLAPYQIFNLGNTSPVTVPMLVSILERHLKVKAKRNVVDMPGNGDVPFTHANITSTRRELGYKPTTDLQTGLKKFVKWYLSYHGYNNRNNVAMIARWSEKRSCPPWQLNSLETIVPENLPRPHGHRKSESVGLSDSQDAGPQGQGCQIKPQMLLHVKPNCTILYTQHFSANSLYTSNN